MAERKAIGNVFTSAYLSILVFHAHTNIYKCIEFSSGGSFVVVY